MFDAGRLVDPMEGWNALVRLFGRPIAFDGGTVTLSASGPPGAGRAIRPVGDAVQVALDLFPFAAAGGGDLSVDDLAVLPMPLRAEVETAAIRAIRDRIPLSLPEPDAPGAALRLGGEWIAAELDLGWGAPARLLLGGARTALGRAARRLSDLGSGPLSAAAAEAVRVPLLRTIGAVAVPLGRVAALEKGDVLVPQSGPALMSRGLRIGLVRGRDGWTVGEILMGEAADGTAPDDPAPEGGAGAPMGTLDELPVSLSLVIGSVDMTLAELRGLSAGSVITDRDAPLGSPVRVLANGRDYAEGELIDLDGIPAVRLTRILPGA